MTDSPTYPVNFTVVPTSDLRALCIKKNWFTCGTNE